MDRTTPSVTRETRSSLDAKRSPYVLRIRRDVLESAPGRGSTQKEDGRRQQSQALRAREAGSPGSEAQGTRSGLKSQQVSPQTPAPTGRGFRALAQRPARAAFPDEADEFLLRERRPAQIALEFVAALFAQYVELLAQLDALGDHVHFQAVGHRDDRPRDGDVVL